MTPLYKLIAFLLGSIKIRVASSDDLHTALNLKYEGKVDRHRTLQINLTDGVYKLKNTVTL